MFHNKMTKMDYVVEAFLWLFGACICIVILYPILHMFAISLSAHGPVVRREVNLFPRQFTLEAYQVVFSNTKILRSFLNSIYVTGVTCILSVTAVFFAAYPLACCKFPGKKIYNMFVLIPMWFGGGIVPAYLCIQKLGLVNTYWALILGGLISSYNVLITTSFLRGIPVELTESARIDGAGEFRIMLQIIGPMSKAVLATVAIWVIAATWNAYLGPMIYLTDSTKYTLQQVLRAIVLEAEMSAYDISVTGRDSSNMADQIRYAVLIVSMVPMTIVYPFAQKYFVKGVTLGAVKG